MRPAGTGGTGQSVYVTGDLLYSSAANTLSRRAAGSTGTVLTMVAGVPDWAGVGGLPAVSGLVGLNNAGTPTSQYDLSAQFVTLRNPTTGATRTVAAATTVTNNIAAATTTNGRDQAAAFTASSWVYFYFTGTGTGSPTTLSSASSSGPTLLAGQTEWALAGAVYNNATPLLVKTRTIGETAWYEAGQVALATGAATTEATVSLATLVPPIATRVYAGVNIVDSAARIFRFRIVSGSDFRTVNSDGSSNDFYEIVFPNISQQFLYIWSAAPSAGVDVNISGYSLPNGGG